MRSHLYSFVLLVLLVNLVHHASAQTGVTISGKVVDHETREAIPFVHVYTRSIGTLTDEQGRFSISMQRSDTLIFSAIGFSTYTFTLKQEQTSARYEVVIEMDSRTYELDVVKVTAYQNLEQFKQSILELNIPTQKKEVAVNIPHLSKFPRDPGAADQSMGVGATIRGPLSAMYNAFSKEQRERRKVMAYKQQAESDKSVIEKYNVDVVKRVTNLSEKDALRFMEWCKLDSEFVQQSSEYDITVAMLKCLDEFKKTDSL